MAGKDKHMRGMRLYAGPYDLSGDARVIGTMANAFEEIDVAGWDQEYHNFIHNDQRSPSIDSFQAFMNDAAGRALPILDSLDVASVAVVFGSDGKEPVLGDPAYLIPAIQLVSTVSIAGGIAAIDVNFMGDADQYDAEISNPMGVAVKPKTALTVTDDGISIDQLAQSAVGAWAILQVLVSDGGTWVFKVQDSDNDIAWADLITFTITGDLVEAEVGSVAGTVDQYIRLQATRTSGTCTVACQFARNYATW